MTSMYESVDDSFEMVFRIGNDFLECNLLSISDHGLKAKLIHGTNSLLDIGAQGECIFDFLDESFEGSCTIAALGNSDIDLVFKELDEDQLFFVRSIIEAIAG